MQRIQIGLRLDTPLLLGGSTARTFESTCVIRPPSLRGLFRTFTRAYLGYLLGDASDKATRIRELESALLGAAGADDGGGTGNTYRVAHIGPSLTPSQLDEYAIVPKPQDPTLDEHDREEHGRITGFADASPHVKIEVSIPPRSLDQEGYMVDALEGICWLSLTLGSLGKRSRRGYGSLSIVSLNRMDLQCRAASSPLPTFVDVADSRALAELIQQGLNEVEQRFRAWINPNTENWHPSYHWKEFFFQFPGTDQIYISEPVEHWRTLMEHFDLECHRQSVQRNDDGSVRLGDKGRPMRKRFYGDHIGSGSPRLASPVWMRVHQVGSEYVALISVSEPGDPAAKRIAQALVKSVTINHKPPKSTAEWCQ